MMTFTETLESLKSSGNLRTLPVDRRNEGVIDFSTNDYLGFGHMTFAEVAKSHPELLDAPMTSSASRLLAGTQNEYEDFEDFLNGIYGRPAILFNSGYHINTGIIPAICDRSTLILADKLVHASIIDGMLLSRAQFRRFPHNDLQSLESMIAESSLKFNRIIVVVESVYSMDGDSPDMERLIELKRKYPRILLYVDEAHAFGVNGPHGLGYAAASSSPESFDFVIATLGKAAASFGAFAIVSEEMKQFLINRSRSLIFSTSLPPVQVIWSRLMVEKILSADNERRLVEAHSMMLHKILSEHSAQINARPSHIQALIVGDPIKAVEMSKALRNKGIVVLPIRTPTVPAGTERLRFSLSAALSPADILTLSNALK